MSWAATGFSAVARRAWPTTVRVKNACSAAMAARPTASITRFCGTITMPAIMRPFGRYGCGIGQGRRAPHEQRDVDEDDAPPDGGDDEVERRPVPAHRPEAEAVDQVREHGDGESGENEEDGHRQRRPRRQRVADHAAHHHEVRVGEVQEPRRPVDHAEADGDEAVDRPDGEAEQELPDELRHPAISATSPLVPSIGGRRMLHGCAASSAAAAVSTAASCRRRPTICRPTGRPARVNPHGMEMAGRPRSEKA